jgi:tetratricopeptide (TPR) repeat protein
MTKRIFILTIVVSVLSGIAFPQFLRASDKTSVRQNVYKKLFKTYSATIDISVKDDTVTVRDRDTMEQERIKVNKLKDYFNAMEAFLRATELNPASAIDYANVGYCLKAINQLPTAEIFFRKALQLAPDLTMAKRGLEYCEAFLNTKN